MNQLGVALGIASFLLLAAVGESITFSFAAGIAVLVMVSGLSLQEKPKKKSRKAKKKARKPSSRPSSTKSKTKTKRK